MTTKTARPAPPRRPFTLIVPAFVAAIGFAVGGAFATWAQGVVWGVIAGAALLLAFRLADQEILFPEQVALFAATVASTVLSTVVISDVPESVSPMSTIGFAAAWLPLAGAATWLGFRRGIRPTKAVNMGVMWLGAAIGGYLSVLSFGVLVPIDWLGPVDEPSYSGSIFAFIGFVTALIGISGSFSILSKLPSLAAAVVGLVLTGYAGTQVGFTIPGLIENIGNVTNVPNVWPPDFDWAIGDSGTWWQLWTWEFGARTVGDPLIETFRIAVVSTLVGCTLALPVAFMASKITTLNTSVYLPDKAFMNLVRTIPDLFWAMIFVAAVGPRPFAGAIALSIFSLAIMAKLLSETIDGVDPGPLEAAKSTGAKHFPAIRSAVLPQVLPNYVAYALYIFEINVRASAVIGLVGAGGIGRILEAQRVFFRFDRVFAVVIAIFVIVFLIEQVSVALRRRLV